MTVGILLLAAGYSRRFGADKRLLPLSDGRSLLQTAIDNVCRAGLPLLVCLRASDDELELALSGNGIQCTRCPESRLGMGHTLAHGVSSIKAAWSGVLVGLADMPMIHPDTYVRLAHQLGPGRIVVPTYRGRRGHPVGFDRTFYPQLEQLQGDRGARGVLATNPAAVLAIEIDDPGILTDIDLPA